MHNKKTTIVESVTAAVNLGDDTYWSVGHNEANNGECVGFVCDASFQETDEQMRDRLRMEVMTLNPGSMKLWAD